MLWTVEPFDDAPLDHVPLQYAPLAHVVAQVRFPALTGLMAGNSRWQEIADRLEAEYPLRDPRDFVEASLAQWRVQDVAGEWFVTITDRSASLSTNAYGRRDDFIARIRLVWEQLLQVVTVPVVERVGFRYINREHLGVGRGDVRQVFHHGALGLLDASRGSGAVLEHGLTQVQYRTSETEHLLVRVGVLPAGSILDDTLPPAEQTSWILDVDAYDEERLDPASDGVVDSLLTCNERAYRFFRATTTDAALVRFDEEES